MCSEIPHEDQSVKYLEIFGDLTAVTLCQAMGVTCPSLKLKTENLC